MCRHGDAERPSADGRVRGETREQLSFCHCPCIGERASGSEHGYVCGVVVLGVGSNERDDHG
jgi:hypothetical protein